MRKTIGALLLGIMLIEPDLPWLILIRRPEVCWFKYYWAALPVLASW